MRSNHRVSPIIIICIIITQANFMLTHVWIEEVVEEEPFNMAMAGVSSFFNQPLLLQKKENYNITQRSADLKETMTRQSKSIHSIQNNLQKRTTSLQRTKGWVPSVSGSTVNLPHHLWILWQRRALSVQTRGGLPPPHAIEHLKIPAVRIKVHD